MHKPMSDAEWHEFCSVTLHGSPPWETLRRIYATVDQRGVERDALRQRNRELRVMLERLYIVAQAAYLKHSLDHEGIGWGELGQRLMDELCNAVGTDEAQARLEAAQKDSDPLDKEWFTFDGWARQLEGLGDATKETTDDS